MYPLAAVLVNCPDSAIPELRGALAENGVAVAAEFPSAEELLAAPPAVRAGEKRLFVVRVRSLDEAAALGRTDAAFPGHPVLAVVEGDYDPAALFRVSRCGAAQILPVPLLSTDLNEALDRILTQFGVEKTVSRVVAVGGATEGAGATTAAVGLAAEVASLSGRACVLAELARGLGRLAGLLNLSPPLTTADLLTGPDGPNLAAVQAALVPLGEGVSVLAGPYRTLSPVRPLPGAVPQLVRRLRQLAGFVVLDLPGTFDEEYFEAVRLADEVVVVARQDVPSVQAARVLLETLRERGLPEPVVVLNQFDPDREAFSPGRVGELVGARRVVPVRADPDGVRAAANAGKFLRAECPHSPVVRDLRRAAAEILHGTGVAVSEGRPTVWRWVREKLGLGGR